ncbi:hypothetical protein JW796_00925 [Candidatus Dojkabacteria bacterium]|nr:hypothetical protein [Candidatus Dojkabacteria bacterium]
MNEQFKSKRFYIVLIIVTFIAIVLSAHFLIFKNTIVPSKDSMVNNEKKVFTDFMSYQANSVRNLASLPITRIIADDFTVENEVSTGTVISLDLKKEDLSAEFDNPENYPRQKFLTSENYDFDIEDQINQEGTTEVEYRRYLDLKIKETVYNEIFLNNLDEAVKIDKSMYWMKYDNITSSNLTQTEYDGIEPPSDPSITFQLNEKQIKAVDYFKKLENFESSSINAYPLFENQPIINLFSKIKIIEQKDVKGYFALKIGSYVDLSIFEQKEKIEVPIANRSELIRSIQRGNVFLLNDFEIESNSTTIVFNEAKLGYFLALGDDTSLLIPAYHIKGKYKDKDVEFYTYAIAYEKLLDKNYVYTETPKIAYINPIVVTEVTFNPTDSYRIKGVFSETDYQVKGQLISKPLSVEKKRIIFIFPDTTDEKYNQNEEIAHNIDRTIWFDEDGTFQLEFDVNNFWEMYNAEKIKKEVRSKLDNYFQLVLCISYKEIANKEFCSAKSIRTFLPVHKNTIETLENNNPVENKKESLDEGLIREIFNP